DCLRRSSPGLDACRSFYTVEQALCACSPGRRIACPTKATTTKALALVCLGPEALRQLLDAVTDQRGFLRPLGLLQQACVVRQGAHEGGIVRAPRRFESRHRSAEDLLRFAEAAFAA